MCSLTDAIYSVYQIQKVAFRQSFLNIQLGLSGMNLIPMHGIAQNVWLKLLVGVVAFGGADAQACVLG
eukprot:6008795-Amphidinium_carterae.1